MAMLLYTKLIGGPIAETKDQRKVGEIGDLVLDPEKMIVAGVLLAGKRPFSKLQAISNIDFVQLYNDGLVVSNDESVDLLVENIKLRKLYEDKLCGINQQVVTKSGRSLGHVHDLLIDDETFEINKIYIRKLLSDRIISTRKIISWKGKTITVKDDVEPSVGIPQIETAALE